MIPNNAFHWRTIASLFLSLLILYYTTGCSYFKVKTVSPSELPKLAEIGKTYNYFILNIGSYQTEMFDLKVEDNFIKGTLLPKPNVPVHYEQGRTKRYKPSKERSILHEVHIYLKDTTALYDPGDVNIPLEDIWEIKVIDPNTGLTVASYVFTTLGIIAGVLVVALVIIALTKESCPYIYSYNGETFVFEGETYSGAIFSGLERDDYMPLPHLKSEDGLCKIRIANELKERQFTNLANLLAVSHPAGTKVLTDASGTPHLISQAQPPSAALSESGVDLSRQLANTDRDVFMFNEETDSNHLFLTFEKPPFAQNGKLVLNLKNTLWGDFVYGEFSKKFGSFYMKWVDKQNRLLPEELPEQTSRNDFKLTVSIKTTNGWRAVEQLPPVGPLGARDVVLPLELSDVKTDKIEIRITSSFMFWEIDYAAMDFTPDSDMEMTVLAPTRAFGSNTLDSKAALSFDDEMYLEQLETGEVTEVHFKIPATQPGTEQSYFLHTKGYYNHVRDYTGLPDREALEEFRKPGHFDQFSKKLYKEMTAGEDLATAKK